jgi:hypothetical protein
MYLVLETRHGTSRAPVHLGIAICVATVAAVRCCHRCWLMSKLVVVMVMVVVVDDDDCCCRHGSCSLYKKLYTGA